MLLCAIKANALDVRYTATITSVLYESTSTELVKYGMQHVYGFRNAERFSIVLYYFRIKD